MRDGQRTEKFGWSRISHESQVITACVALGGVVLPPGLPQEYPTKFALAPLSRRAGFEDRE